MKKLRLLLCASVFPFLMGLDFPENDYTAYATAELPQFYFPHQTFKDMMRADDIDAFRFYTAKSDQGISLMAVASVRGMDVRNTNYYLFEGLLRDGASIQPLSIDKAILKCENLGANERLVVTFELKEIQSLLANERSTGIALYYANNSNGNTSLAASSAIVEERKISIVDHGTTIINQSPCPTYCGAAADYLCKMN